MYAVIDQNLTPASVTMHETATDAVRAHLTLIEAYRPERRDAVRLVRLVDVTADIERDVRL